MLQRKQLWIAAAGVVAVFGAVGMRAWLGRRYEDRVYRIGWQNDPPNIYTTPEGKPAGFGPDIVNEAARRRHIRLEWVYVAGPPAESIRTGQVDLWPLMTVFEERKSYVHFSRPYFRNYLAFVVRGDAPYRKASDLRGARAGFYDLPLNRARAPVWLPGSIPVPNHGLKEGLEGLRQRTIDVLIVDELKLVAELLGGADTSGMGLRLIAPERPPAELSVAGSFAVAPVVDALRNEIERMSADGESARLVLGSGIALRREINDMAALIQAQRRVERARLTLAAAALLAALAAVMALAYRRQILSARAADDARRSAEIRLRLVADSLTEMVLAYDMERRLVYANPALERLTGYTVEEIRQAGFIDWMHPEDRARMAGRWQGLFDGDEYFGESYRLIRKDGTQRWMLATWGPLRDEAGVQVGVRGSERDITDLAEAQAEMRRLAQAVEQTTDAVVVTDPEGTIEYVNPAFEAVTGYTREEAVGKNPRLLRSGLHDREFYARMWAVLLSGQAWTGRLTNRRKDGSHYTEQCTISPVLNEDGRIERFLAVKKDVTQELALEEQVRQAQKLESIGKLAGGVAHDFNNLLTVITGNAQLALLALAPGDAARERVARIISAGDRAADLTRQLLTFSRKQAAQPEVLDLNAIILQMEPVLSSLMGDGPTIVFDLSLDKPRAVIDRGHLQQVLMNLAVNARDALEGAGTVTIRSAREGPCALLQVTDTGHGIDESIRKQIFDPFFSTKPPGRGTGLGLAVVYGIVTQCGGSVTVESQVGLGSRFRVLVPAGEGEPHVVQKAAGEEVAHLPVSLLLVEDQQEVRTFVAEVLRGAGHRVTEAVDGASALEAAGTMDALDLLVTDLSMPGMHGRELARRLRARYPGMSVLYMSGYAGEDEPSEWPLLRKPFPPELMLEAVRQLRPQA